MCKIKSHHHHQINFQLIIHSYSRWQLYNFEILNLKISVLYIWGNNSNIWTSNIRKVYFKFCKRSWEDLTSYTAQHEWKMWKNEIKMSLCVNTRPECSRTWGSRIQTCDTTWWCPGLWGLCNTRGSLRLHCDWPRSGQDPPPPPPLFPRLPRTAANHPPGSRTSECIYRRADTL